MHLKIKSLDKVIFLLAIIGVILSTISTVNYYAKKDILCTPTSKTECELVNNSQYAFLFGIYVGILGLLAYLVVIVILLFKENIKKLLFFTERDFRTYFFILVIFMAIFSLYLTLMEEFFINKYCVICIFVFVTTLLLLFTVWETWRLSKHIK